MLEFLLGALLAFTGIAFTSMGKIWSSGSSTLSGLAGMVILGLCFIFIDEKNFLCFASNTHCFSTFLLITSSKRCGKSSAFD